MTENTEIAIQGHVAHKIDHLGSSFKWTDPKRIAVRWTSLLSSVYNRGGKLTLVGVSLCGLDRSVVCSILVGNKCLMVTYLAMNSSVVISEHDKEAHIYLSINTNSGSNLNDRSCAFSPLSAKTLHYLETRCYMPTSRAYRTSICKRRSLSLRHLSALAAWKVRFPPSDGDD